MVKYSILPKTKRRYLVSGGISPKENILALPTYSMAHDTETVSDLLKRLIKQLSGKVDESDGKLIPEYRILGRGHLWCWAPASRKMVKVTRNTGAYVINSGTPGDDRVMIYTSSGDMVLIDTDELELIGFD